MASSSLYPPGTGVPTYSTANTTPFHSGVPYSGVPLGSAPTIPSLFGGGNPPSIGIPTPPPANPVVPPVASPVVPPVASPKTTVPKTPVSRPAPLPSPSRPSPPSPPQMPPETSLPERPAAAPPPRPQLAPVVNQGVASGVAPGAPVQGAAPAAFGGGQAIGPGGLNVSSRINDLFGGTTGSYTPTPAPANPLAAAIDKNITTARGGPEPSNQILGTGTTPYSSEDKQRRWLQSNGLT